ncbi:delta-1-pyrroline-5-carboxylate dehydrogenase, mitochondrial [Drosophila obscura]|uniref:delta-1-pyrroline-5-carboxylate dehydrogenase, mitochondrial n=1 Tax=Drosophila obscura TaxID=7282 RepID=UPI001BB19789|nr:delta-1-pyrroline-5-carboxylate dehydrogenase, mitochondrial [Drosophila obscura]
MLKIAFMGLVRSPLRRRMGAAGLSSEVIKTLEKGRTREPQADSEADGEPRVNMNEQLLINHAAFQMDRKPLEVPTIVGDEQMYTMDNQRLSCPHDLKQTVAQIYYANRCQIESAIKTALKAQATWSLVTVADRLTIWRHAADIIEADEFRMRMYLMLAQGKTSVDAEKDIRRLVTSIRANSDYLKHLSQLRFEIQGEGRVFPSLNLRPMDGFVAAIAPFESVALSANLALCPMLMGNAVLWNPVLEVAPISYLVYLAFKEAGLPKGVLNFVPSNKKLFLDTITDAVHFAGVNCHGSVQDYRYIHKLVSDKMPRYICFPRLVAESAGQNFHFVHSSAKMEAVCSATVEAAFNYAGQYANSLSRMYVPSSMWTELREQLIEAVKRFRVGDPTQKDTRMGPVINRAAYERMRKLMESNKDAQFLCGGTCNDKIGYFVEPTIVRTMNPLDPLLSEPLAGPLLPIFVYADDSFAEALNLAAHQSKHALSGSVFATRDEVISHCLNQLRMAASNLYVNERCTGSSGGLTPFGGNRLSGTNDKSGSAYFLMRWSSPLLVEETVDSPVAAPTGWKVA